MDELEAVELRVSEVLEDNEKFRIDSEFFQKEYLELEKKIKLLKYKRLEDVIETLTDYHANGSYKILNKYVEISEDKNDTLMVRTTDLERDDFDTDVRYISYEAYTFLNKTKVFGGEIIINKIGTNSGNTYLMPFLNRNVSLGMNQFMLKDFKINNYFIYIYLISEIGSKLIKRRINGSAPFSIDKESINILSIPIFSEKFQLKIENIVKKSYQQIEESKIVYKEAENTLLEELNLLDFEPTQENIAIKSFAESFLATGRLDSEYYQPKYDEITEKIKMYKGGVDTIEKLCTLKDSNHKPIKDKFYQYIELSNIGATGDITGCIYNQGQLLPSRARRLVNSNDVIISSIEGSLEKIALVTEEFDNSLCSTGFYVVRSSKINASTLLVLFKNEMMQQILKQNCSGTILTGMNKDEFLNIAIPLIDIEIQKKIETKIKTSFQLKTESKNLLALAKRAVEVAIEEGEERALEMMNENN